MEFVDAVPTSLRIDDLAHFANSAALPSPDGRHSESDLYFGSLTVVALSTKGAVSARLLVEKVDYGRLMSSLVHSQEGLSSRRAQQRDRPGQDDEAGCSNASAHPRGRPIVSEIFVDEVCHRRIEEFCDSFEEGFLLDDISRVFTVTAGKTQVFKSLLLRSVAVSEIAELGYDPGQHWHMAGVKLLASQLDWDPVNRNRLNAFHSSSWRPEHSAGPLGTRRNSRAGDSL